MKSAIDRARVYIAKMPTAIEGQNGSGAAYAVACRLREFDVPFDEALNFMLTEWSPHCDPPWTESELRHKLSDAFKRTQPKPEFTCQRRNTFLAPTARKAICGSAPGRVTYRVTSKPGTSPSNTQTLAASSPPTSVDLRGCNLHPGTPLEIITLATQRGVAQAAVRLMERRGQLRIGQYFRQLAWFTTDTSRNIAIARRMDGERWKLTDGREPKALNVRGSVAAWPIGVLESRNYPCIALVEGSGDALAAHDFILREDRERDCAVVTMASASPLIHPDVLPNFKGKLVCIFTHADNNDTGEKAGERWRAQLATAGATVGCYHCGKTGCKDLNDLARLAGFNGRILP